MIHIITLLTLFSGISANGRKVFTFQTWDEADLKCTGDIGVPPPGTEFPLPFPIPLNECFEELGGSGCFVIMTCDCDNEANGPSVKLEYRGNASPDCKGAVQDTLSLNPGKCQYADFNCDGQTDAANVIMNPIEFERFCRCNDREIEHIINV